MKNQGFTVIYYSDFIGECDGGGGEQGHRLAQGQAQVLPQQPQAHPGQESYNILD